MMKLKKSKGYTFLSFPDQVVDKHFRHLEVPGFPLSREWQLFMKPANIQFKINC